MRITDSFAYSIEMPDGNVEKMTKAEVAARSGLAMKLVSRRIQRGWRDWHRLTMSTDEGLRLNRMKMKALLTVERMTNEAEKRRRRQW